MRGSTMLSLRLSSAQNCISDTSRYIGSLHRFDLFMPGAGRRGRVTAPLILTVALSNFQYLDLKNPRNWGPVLTI
jgi:hypothetical protein